MSKASGASPGLSLKSQIVISKEMAPLYILVL